jgi:hypothetical protein
MIASEDQFRVIDDEPKHPPMPPDKGPEYITTMEMLLDAQWSSANNYFVFVGYEAPYHCRFYDWKGDLIADTSIYGGMGR